MDRLRMVRNLEEVASREGLELDEIRLYLLLLANSDGSGRGRTGCRQLSVIFGQGCDRGRIARAVRRLSDLGLITIITALGVEGRERDFILSYSIKQSA